MATEYTSGSIHFSGLGSDTDFTTMIEQLKRLESNQKARFTLWQADWNRRIDAFQTLNSAMLTLNSKLNSMNTISKFLVKVAGSSNESVLSATAGGNAQNNSYKVQVNKLATNCSYTYQGQTFSSTSETVNASNSTQNFIYTYKGKTVNIAVGANASMQQFINQINNDANNPGVRASLVKNGSEYIFQLQGMDTGASSTLTISPFSSQALKIKPPSSASSGWETGANTTRTISESRFGSANTVINLSGADQTFTFNYGNSSHSVTVADGGTLTDLANSINSSNSNVRAEICKDSKGYYLQMTGLDPSINGAPQIDAGSSNLLALAPTPATPNSVWNSASTTFTASNLQFASANSVVNNSGVAQDFVFNFNGNKHTVSIAAGATLTDMQQAINDFATANSLKLQANITCEGPNNYKFSLANTAAGSTSVPSIDASSSAVLGFNYTGSWQQNTSAKSTTYSTQFASGSAVINTSGASQTFAFNYNGTTNTVNLADGATLDDLVNAINGLGISGLNASLATTSGKVTLKIQGTDATPTIAASSSRQLAVGPGSWSAQSSTLTYGAELSASSVVNNSGANQTFSYTYKGTTRSVTLADGATMQELLDAINNDPANAGVVEAAISSNGQFTLKGIDTKPEAPMIADGSSRELLIVPPVGWGNVKNGASSTLDKTFTSDSAVINNSGSSQKFSYTYGGKTITVDVPNNATLADLADIINKDSNNNGVIAALQLTDSGEYAFKLTGVNLGVPAPTVAANSSRQLEIMPPDCQYDSSKPVPVSSFSTLFNSGSDVINSSGSPQKLVFEYQNKVQSLTVPDGATLDDVVGLINSSGLSIRANLLDEGGQKKLQLWGTDPGATMPPMLSISSSKDLAITPPDIGSDGWFVQLCSNAQLKLNDWPVGDNWIESESNSPNEVIDGVTLNLKQPGTSQITVTTGSDQIKEQVVALVDALNTVRVLIKDLTKVDEAKEVEKDITKSASAFAAQMGSILTGNYGVQLLSSKLKTTTASAAQGFQYQTTAADGLIHGDLFTSLSQVGINTVSDTKDPNFGMLTIDEAKLDAALARDAQAVAELFAADNVANTDSSDFAFASYITGTTKPGVYEVKYNIDANGNVVNATIGGYEASYDAETGQLTSKKGPAQGLAININNTQEGTYKGAVTLKMGKIGELAALTKELNSDEGILSILKRNYQDISDGIQKKIDKEEERLVLWERTMRNKFARLETTLTRYNGLQKQLESQIKQLGSGSSK